MVLLDKDSYELLTYLLGLTVPETIMSISKTIHQSRRKIYYSLEKINDAISGDVDPIISVPRVGILLNQQQKEVCQQLLMNLDDYSYVMSMEERMQLMLIYIAISPERVTIEKLMKLTDVSRNTTLNDLNEIRNKLEQDYFYVKLHVTKAHGYVIKCLPLDKIQYIYSLLFTIFSQGNESFINILEKKVSTQSEVADFFRPEIAEKLRVEFKTLRKTWGKSINRHEVDFIIHVLPYVMLSYRNMQLTNFEKEKLSRELTLVRKRIEYDIAKKISRCLKESCQIDLDDLEVALLGILLLSSRKDIDIHTDTRDFQDIQDTVSEFLDCIETKTPFRVIHRDELSKRLLIHCKALVFRKTYGIPSRNPLTEQIKLKYKNLFEATVACISVLEKAWLIKMTDDDIAHITIHLGGHIKSVSETRKVQKLCIICDEGLAIQRLLARQLKYYFPDIEIGPIFTTEQFYSVRDILEVDIIVKTSEISTEPFESVRIHPILMDTDIPKISQLLTKRKNNFPQFTKRLNQLISTYIKSESEREMFGAQLQKLIQENLQQEHLFDGQHTDIY